MELAIALALTATASHADSMTSNGRCIVVGGQMLPAASGGTDGLCNAVERAMGAAAPHARYKVQITVISPARLSATLVVDGRTLPEQKFAIMDRQLSRGAIERFAQAIAAEVAKTAKS